MKHNHTCSHHQASKSCSSTKQSQQPWLMAIVFVIGLLIAGYQLWLAWPTMVLKSIEWQRAVNTQLADLLYDAQDNPLIAGSYLMGFSFLYGVLHALGPGHGKVIVTTYLATQPTKVKTSLFLTLTSALCQAFVAIALVSVLVWGLTSSMREVNSQAVKFMMLSSMMVSLLGLMIGWRAIRKLLSQLKPQPHDHDHQHSHGCGCGHSHIASPQEVDNAKTLREYIGVIVSIGLRPCTGAIMVLLFANMVGLYWMGIASAIAMSLGTALTTSVLALLTLSGKKFVHHYLHTKQHRDHSRWQAAGYGVQLLGGIILILLGALLIVGQDVGLSPMFSL
ncbi:nickel/cobalt transporter [Vibrio sp. WXL103]|uniref:nickel/cobalt transporter n=1 Tax=Vibrio sp. WXL103 TaxID=3450710 RepID=UPI003EC68E1C